MESDRGIKIKVTFQNLRNFSKSNVISRISSCDKSVAGFWLTKTLQMFESCMLFGAKVAKGGPLGRVG